MSPPPLIGIAATLEPQVASATEIPALVLLGAIRWGVNPASNPVLLLPGSIVTAVGAVGQLSLN